jgi:Uma2 family endonuclease
VLDAHVRAKGIGLVLYAPLDVILSDASIVQPDIVYLDSARLKAISRRGIEGAPTLLVEVLSPSTTVIDRSTKRQLYRRYGVPYYWIVDPEAHTIEAYSLSEGEYQLLARASGPEAVFLAPFPDLSLVPSLLWP